MSHSSSPPPPPPKKTYQMLTANLVLVLVAVVVSYSLSNNHTYISMGITVVFLAASLLSLLALYNKLAPKPTRTQEELTRHTSVNFLSILDAQRHSPGIYV